MKKIIYPLLGLLSLFPSTKINAQCAPTFSNGAGLVEIFSENFDSVQTKWKMTTYGTPLNRPTPFYREALVTKDNSLGAATDTVGSGTTSYLVSPSMRVDTFTSVNLSFDHICYEAQLNYAQIEYSWDSTSWTPLPAITYNGPSLYNIPFFNPNTFNSRSNAVLWKANDSTFTWGPGTMAWVREDFDITPVINGSPNDSMMWFRFRLENPPSAPQGREGTRRWFIDNFEVRGGNCELTPPQLTVADPPLNYPARYQNRVYLTGPYLFDAQILDNSGIDTAKVIYEIKRDTNPNMTGPPQWAKVYSDCIGMTRQPGGNFSARLERILPNGDSIQVADTICWMIETFDGSPCRNRNQDPPVGWEAFEVRPNLPKSCGTQPVFNFPYYQTFDAPAFQPQNPTLLAEDWNNVSGDFHDWAISTGPTSDTGSFRIFTDHPGGNKFLYVESERLNRPLKDSTAFLLSPCIDLLELRNGLVRFYVNMNTAGIEDELRVDIFDPTPLPNFPNGKFVQNVIPPITGNKGNVWLPFEFSTFPYRNTITQIRFVGTPGRDDGLGDIGLDSFKIIPAALTDARLNEVVIGPFIPAGEKADSGTIALAVQNLGVSAITNATLQYEISNESGVLFTSKPYNWTGNVPPGQIQNVTIPERYKVPLGIFSVRGWLTYTGDEVIPNDTSSTNSRGILYCPIKYMDDFDGDTSWVVFVEGDSLANAWELGRPNTIFTYDTYTPPNAWDILLNRPYTGTGRTVTLLSPFFDFSQADSIILSFLNNRSADTTEDGMFIEYSLDRGLTWDSLRSLQDPGKINWYNSTLSAGGFGGQPVFSDNTFCFSNGKSWNGWLESELLLADNLDNQSEVLLRFSFFAESNPGGDDGISIDNIMIYDQEQLDMHSMHYLSPGHGCNLSATQKFESVFKNRGLSVVNSFEVEYRVRHIPTNTLEVKTDVINRTVLQRDTIHVLSQSTFDMFALGDYDVQIIAKLNGDGCSENDTLRRLVEQIDGCEFQFLIATSHRPNFQQPCDSTVWRFTYTQGGRDYQVSQAYNWPVNPINIPPGVNDTIDDLLVCIKDGAQVRFDLNDRDTLISSYSLIGFNGEQDTVLFDEIDGGPDSPTKFFTWNCPPDLSASPQNIWIDFDNGRDKIQLPIAKDYRFDVTILNNGLDSLDSLELYFEIDGVIEFIHDVRYIPWLDYNRKRRFAVGTKFLAPGKHTLRTWTRLPNGLADEVLSDDTLSRMFTVMDTIRVDSNIYAPYCDNFDDPMNSPLWISADPYDSNQDSVIFELGTPSTSVINTTNSGPNAWVTNLDGDYPNGNASALFSPFFYLEKDSCYKVSFMHNFFISDSTQDGVSLKMRSLNASGFNELDDWVTIGNSLGDTLQDPGDPFPLQKGWYNTLHILAIPGVDNSGWSGDSKGWVLAENTLPVVSQSYYTALRWRFEADGSLTSDGWAIDDFCLESIPAIECNAVGLREHGFDKSQIYLAQNIPNPAENNTSIPYYLPRAGKVRFMVTNMVGQIIYEKQLNHPSGDGRLELDISNMSNGIYYYTMIYEENRVTRKMIISK